ncbi:hypothetical protein [Reyranella sp.]|jgi:uncharacterized protein
MVMLNDPPPPVPAAAAERGMRHWTIIGIGAAILVIVFLISR